MSKTKIRVQITDPHDPHNGDQYDTTLDAHMVQTDLESGRITRVARIFTDGGRIEEWLVTAAVQAALDAGSIHEVFEGEDYGEAS